MALPVESLNEKTSKSYARVRVSEGFPYNTYDVLEPVLSKNDLEKAKAFIRVILRQGSISELQKVIPSVTLSTEFRKQVIQPIDMKGIIQKLPVPADFDAIEAAFLLIVKKLKIENPEMFTRYVMDETIGYRDISEMMRDEQLEEIMINGSHRNLFVFHRKHGMCKTNIVAEEHGFAIDIIMRVSQTVNKQFNESHPLLDARLPDGSRANATFSYVTPFGHSLTIRRFSKIPLSVIHVIENNTISVELAAFLWLMVEGLNVDPMNVIVTGGAGSGKTTLLNILSSFIPFQNRILSIEDTLELDLGVRENWIQMESKPKIKDLAEVTMDDLLKNALRMRPDRLIVGEVRGPEAQTMFVAMDTGHRGILGTVHSNTSREMMLRLKTSPMNVPESMLPLLDLVVVMQRSYSKESGMIRTIKHVSEISNMGEKVLLSNIFEFERKKGVVKRTDIPSGIFEDLAQRAGLSKNELKGEMLVRQRILEWMLEQGIKGRDKVESIIQEYYSNPKGLLERITGEI